MVLDVVPSMDQLADKRWRLENLYLITDKNGKEVPFKLNWAQSELHDRMWYQMLILKARQLGVTTFFAINFLDDCFWYPNMNAAIIADKKDSSEIIFKRKIKYAYDRMPAWTKAYNAARNDRVGELTFENGSSFIVSTGVRSGTYQRLLISEFGKICIKQPEQAKEIVSGSLNTVSPDQIVIIESTAMGREGYFYNFSQIAEKLALSNKKLSPLEQRFFFFPWFREPIYRDSNESVVISDEVNQYLDTIEQKVDVTLDDEQRRWYFLKQEILGDSMKSEYPSTPQEAFESANEGYYYAQKIAKLRKDGNVCRVPYSEYSLVHTAWDLGLDDHTAIWFFQLGLSGEIQIIDYYENRDEDAKHYCDVLRKKGYSYGTHILPHDAGNRSIQNKLCYADIVQPLLDGDIHIMEIKDVFTGIQAVRSILSRCVFDKDKCQPGLERLESYKRKWDDKLGGYKNTPIHDGASHGSDAFRMLATGLQFCGSSGSLEDDMQAVRSYWG